MSRKYSSGKTLNDCLAASIKPNIFMTSQPYKPLILKLKIRYCRLVQREQVKRKPEECEQMMRGYFAFSIKALYVSRMRTAIDSGGISFSSI